MGDRSVGNRAARMEELMSRSSIQRARILVVDDEPSNAALIRAMLATAGFDCVQVHHDPRHALEDVGTRARPRAPRHAHARDRRRGVHAPNARRNHRHGFVPVLVLTADRHTRCAQGRAASRRERLPRQAASTPTSCCCACRTSSRCGSATWSSSPQRRARRELHTRVHFEIAQAADRVRVVEAVSR